MIVFGTAISDRTTYEEIALPGIRRAAEPDSAIIVREGYDSIQRPYNEIMDEAAALPDLEALVLLHQDLELTDGSLPARIRRLSGDPRIGLIGSFGARDVRLHCGFAVAKTETLFGTASVEGFEARHSSGAHEVELVDGSLLVVSPWATRSIRFYEPLAEHFHGYDIDFSQRVRAAGGRVICDDIPYVHRMRRPYTDDDRAAYRAMCGVISRMWEPEIRPAEWAPAFSTGPAAR